MSERAKTSEQPKPKESAISPGKKLLLALKTSSSRMKLTREVISRRLAYIMLVRVILFTMILGGTVIVNLAWGTLEALGGPYVTFLFVFIAAIYVLNIIYALLLRWFKELAGLTLVQLGVDLITSTILVHFTGGADSGFVLFFLLTPIAAAVTLDRRSAVISAIAGVLLFSAVVSLGYVRRLPLLPGQSPIDVSPDSLARSLLVNGSAIIAVAVLAGYLAEQLKFAAEKVQVQQAHIDDLATLNTDIIRCLTSGLVTVNEQGTILSMNQAAGEILEIPQHLAGGKRLQDIAPELADLVATSDKIRRTEVTIHRKSKDPLLLGISVSPLTDHLNQTLGRIINFQDLTQIKQMEEIVRRSEQLSSLGRMAAGVAHEIRNPLASISGSLQLLRAEELDSENAKLMEIAMREIERLNDLINSFLDYARPRPPELKKVDLASYIYDLINELSELMIDPKMPKLEVKSRAGAWVMADLDQLRGVIWNLVYNAWEAGEQDLVRIKVYPRNRWVVIEVTDSAMGIPADQLGQVFEPFFTTKEGGTGLGLATVYRTIQQHGGEVDITSVEGRGTTATIMLPQLDPNMLSGSAYQLKKPS